MSPVRIKPGPKPIYVHGAPCARASCKRGKGGAPGRYLSRRCSFGLCRPHTAQVQRYAASQGVSITSQQHALALLDLLASERV